jgi:phosphatidate cytidylyltransferase
VLVPLGATGLVLFIAVSIADVVAYFAGPRLGGPRLSAISPAKRWSGTAAEVAAGLGAPAPLEVLTWPRAIAVAVGGPAGDLLESMVKRGGRRQGLRESDTVVRQCHAPDVCEAAVGEPIRP